jgi:hypothetical protein
MNYPVLVCVAKAGTHLFDIAQHLSERHTPLPAGLLKITAGQILQDQIMKHGAAKIPSSTMAETAYYIRMSDPIQRDRFVLKILDKRSLEIRIRIVLEKYIQGLDHNQVMRRMRRR